MSRERMRMARETVVVYALVDLSGFGFGFGIR